MKIRRSYSLIIIASIIMATSGCSMFKKAGSNAIILKYKFEQGDNVTVKTATISKIEMEQMGQTITVDIESNNVLANKALSAEDGNINMEMTFKDMFQKVESQMGAQETDYSDLLGKTASFKLGPDGTISDKQGFKDLPEITTATGETVGGELYEQITDGLFIKLPSEPVKTGYTWTDKDESDMPYAGGNLKITSSTVYTVGEKVEVDGMKCIRINIVGEVKTEGSFVQNGMDMTMSRTANSSGHYIFAPEKGMYLSMDIKSTENGIIDVPAAGMKIPQSITNSITGEVSFD